MEWQFCSHLVFFVKKEGKEQFCAVLWRFRTGILALVLTKFQDQRRKGENYSSCAGWLNRKKKINDLYLILVQTCTWDMIWNEFPHLNSPCWRPGASWISHNSREHRSVRFDTGTAFFSKELSRVFLTSIDLNRIYTSWTQVCVQILLLL